MGAEMQTELDRMLTRLKLTAVRDQLDTLLDEAARSEMTLRDALAFLCEREIARKDQRRVDMALSGISCAAGDSGKEGEPPWPDCSNL